jgi:hypothetical protein
MADNFPHFQLGSGSVICMAAIGFPLLADSGTWHTATKLFELEQETYSHY